MQAQETHSRAYGEEERYLQQVRSGASRRELLTELGDELELRGPLLERLVRLGITPDTAPAFEALPLVAVAWADGAVDPEERWRVLRVATAFGLELGRPAHAQIELWLRRAPDPVLFDAWRNYAIAVLRRPEASARASRLLEGVHEVAEAAGGVLGIRSISAAERAVIDEVRDALARFEPQQGES